MAVIGTGCSIGTEAVAQQARYYGLPVVRTRGGSMGEIREGLGMEGREGRREGGEGGEKGG